MTRIALIHPSSPTSEGTGATHSATRIIEHLAERGHDITAFCLKSPASDTNNLDFEVGMLNQHRSLLSTGAQSTNSAIEDGFESLPEYDIVHSYDMRSIPSIGKLGLEHNVRTAVTLNAYGAICPRNDLLHANADICSGDGWRKCASCVFKDSTLRSQAEQTSLPQTIARTSYRTTKRLREYKLVRKGKTVLDGIDGFHALSDPVKQHYTNFGFQSGRINVIPNIADDHFDVEHSSNFKEPFKLLYVGALRHRKGADRLVEFAKLLRDTHDLNFTFTVVGTGPWQPTLEQQVSKWNLSDHVTITGRIEYRELPAVYAAHDVFVYLGRWDEPFGRVFLESLGAGTPIFSTDVGAINDITGNAGLLTSKHTVPAIAADCADILSPTQLESAASASQSQFDQYTSERIIDQFEAFYDFLS